MDLSDEITDDVPCFIVPDSQASQNGCQDHTATVNTVALRGLMTYIQPTTNVASDKNIGDSESSDSTVFPNSSSSGTHSNCTSMTSSLPSSKSDSSSESSEKIDTTKKKPLFLLCPNNVSQQHTSTPTIQSNISPACHTVERITPVEHGSAPSMYKPEECKVKETSSSDEFYSPSLPLKEIPSEEEQEKEKDQTVAFKCLQMSGESNHEGSSAHIPSSASELLGPESPGEVVQEERPIDKNKICNDQQSWSDKRVDITNENMTASTLPLWQQHMTRPEKALSTYGSITKTLSDASTVSSRTIAPEESFPHQWQSPENDSDCDMFEKDPDSQPNDGRPTGSQPKNNNPQSLPAHQSSNFNGLSLPKLSQDIFQHKLKGVVEKSEGKQISTEKPLESSPTGDVVLSSQDDVFCLHLTQSQSGTPASQARSQTDRLSSSHNVQIQRTTDKEEEHVISPTSPILMGENAVNDTTPTASHVDDGNAVNNVTPPCVLLSSTITKQTPIGQPSSTGHQEVISNKTITGEIINISSDSSVLSKEAISDGNELTDSIREDITDGGSIEEKTDGKMNESTESVESGLVGFHFSPPAMLLKPVPRVSPLRLETGSESSQDVNPLPEITSTAEFRTVSPDLITSRTEPTVRTLSLSVPVLCEENTDDQVFNLQKDILDDETSVTSPTSSKRSVFTNIREKFPPARTTSPGDGVDPFEFRDEIYTPPIRKRRRQSRNVSKSRAKKGKIDTGGIARSNLDQVDKDHDTRSRKSNLNTGEQQAKARFWKVFKTTVEVVTTTLTKTRREIIFTTQDGKVIKEETDYKISEPTCKTTSDVTETREEVDEIPKEITFSSLRNTEELCDVETDKSIDNSKTRVEEFVQENVMPSTSRTLCTGKGQSKKGVKSNSETVEVAKNKNKTVSSVESNESVNRQSKEPTTHAASNNDVSKTAESSIREGRARNLILDRECINGNTSEENIPILERGESSKSSLSTSSSTPNTISPPLFPPSADGNSSASLDAGLVSNVPSNEEGLVTKTTAKNRKSLSERNEKRKRSISADSRATSRKFSTSPRILNILDEGTRVFALWYDKHYYPGQVVSKSNTDTKYRIKFDDGDESEIREQCFFVVDYLPRDQPVMFCEKPGGIYIDGVIKGFYKDGDDKGYKVLGEDKKVVLCPRSNVMLREEQAAIYLSLIDCITKPSASPKSVNCSSPLNGSELLDAVVNIPKRSNGISASKSRSDHKDTANRPLTDRDTNTKRKSQGKRKEKYFVTDFPPNDNSTITKKRCRGDENVKTVVSEKESATKKRKEEKIVQNKNYKGKESDAKHQNSSPSETPKSSHKSSKKSSGKGISDSKNSDVNVSRVRRRLSTAMKGLPERSHLIPARTSPRKHNPKVAGNENLILPTKKNLFRGYGFILTGSDVISVPDENSPREEEQVVYIRDDVIKQIKTGGGEVLDKFPKDNPRESCFLLSNESHTTAKYFNALVLGVPCVSHAWVRDCCVENRLINFKSYLLPAGKDLITDNLVEAQNYKDALRELKVHLVGEDEFKQHWTEVLNAAGCEIVHKLPNNILQKLQHEDQEYICDVIVVGNGQMERSTVQKARLLNIPTLTIHWVKQCILTGQRVDFNAHPSFIYRVPV